MNKLKGPRVELVEKRLFRPIEAVLATYESYRTPISKISQDIDVPAITINYWRKKLGYNRQKNDI